MTTPFRIVVVNNAEPDIRDFVAPINQLLGENGYTYEQIEYRQMLHMDIDGFHGVILSGSPTGDDIAFSHQKYYSWVDTYKKPILGVCAGHQILGVRHGAELIRGSESEKGNDVSVQIKCANDPIFCGMEGEITTLQMHNDSVTCSDDFTILASSEKCNNQVMKSKDRPFYTVQFHAEISNHDIILNFLRICEKHRFDNAV